MSLEALRAMRRAGHRPDVTLKLVVGAKTHLSVYPDVIAVLPDEVPERMDWRAVIGLPLTLFVADGHDELAERAWKAAMQAGAQAAGAAWRNEGISVDPEARPVLERMWEVLCTS